MRKIVTALIIAGLLSATSVVTAHADGCYGGVSVFNPLWPVAAALSIPAAIVGGVVSATVPVPVVGYGYSAPVVYPAPYYAPGPYYGPGGYYGGRGYYGPRGYWGGHRGYYGPRGYGGHGGWRGR